MRTMRALGYTGRFFVMGFLISWFTVAYLLGRIGAAFIWRSHDREKKRAAISALHGRILRRAMTRLGATFVKLGQVMSTRPDLLDPETIDELRKLQDRLPAFPIESVRRILVEDLGAPVEERFAELDDKPIAAASVSQVHRARLLDGREVAVKVLRPDVRKRVERDAAILGLFARIAALHPDVRLSDPVGHSASSSRASSIRPTFVSRLPTTSTFASSSPTRRACTSPRCTPSCRPSAS